MDGYQVVGPRAPTRATDFTDKEVDFEAEEAALEITLEGFRGPIVNKKRN